MSPATLLALTVLSTPTTVSSEVNTTQARTQITIQLTIAPVASVEVDVVRLDPVFPNMYRITVKGVRTGEVDAFRALARFVIVDRRERPNQYTMISVGLETDHLVVVAPVKVALWRIHPHKGDPGGRVIVRAERAVPAMRATSTRSRR